MPIGASRLGFFFKRTERSYKKRILCFYDPFTNGPGGNTNYYATTVDKKPATDIYPPIAARAVALGYTTDLVQSYSALLATDLQNYSQIWDIGYASPYTTNPVDPTRKLTNYLKSGGSLFLLGENSSFQPRDNTIGSFIEGLGGGVVEEGTQDFNYSRDLTVLPLFLNSNNSNEATFSRPGVFTSKGNGTNMTTHFPLTGELEYPAVMWLTGNLVYAPLGSVISVLDLNFITGIYQNNDFIDNVIESLNVL